MLPADLETLKEIAQQLSGRGVGEWVVEERGFNLSHLVGPNTLRNYFSSIKAGKIRSRSVARRGFALRWWRKAKGSVPGPSLGL